MEKLKIIGGKRLKGLVSVSGAKNAALPILAAGILTEGTLDLTNVPYVWDILTMLRLLFHIGADQVILRNGKVAIRIP